MSGAGAHGCVPVAAIPGVALPISRIVLGVDHQTELEPAGRQFEDYLARGGNAFDTAWQYRAGRSEAVLGEWLEREGLRDRVVIVGKGAHTPDCDPESIGRQLTESLARLRTSRVDLYLMHRDNPDVPVGEFLDALDAERQAGRLGAYGVSNWSLERVRAANDHADAAGRPRLAAVSNNLSLARMVEPVWAGCISAKGPDWKAWFRDTGTALLAWSSQARGFFLPRAPTQDPEMARCWFAPDNLERLARAELVASARGVQPINVALAWVLAQPFPAFALAGPRTTAETASTFRALELELSPAEIAWLDLAADEPPPGLGN